MNFKPIRTEEDCVAACRRIDEIFQAEAGSPEDDELEVLVTLVDAYEGKRFPIGMPHPIDAIKISMEASGLNRKDLMGHLGKSSGRISDILNCRRALTLGDVRTLSKLLHLSTDVLSQEYRIERSKAKDSVRATGCAATF